MSYYDTNARAFFDNTIDVVMDELYNEFIPLIRKDAHVLDLGCGSGRDSKHFILNGYKVTAYEPSKELAELAAHHIGQDVKVRSVQDMNEYDLYDGVWACASLLHVPKSEMVESFKKISNSLKRGGVLYCSFKLGEQEVERAGRTFTNMNRSTFDELINAVTSLKIISIWVSSDVRPDRADEKWFNAILKKLD